MIKQDCRFNRIHILRYDLHVYRNMILWGFNPIMSDNYAAFFNCTPVGQVSLLPTDGIKVPISDFSVSSVSEISKRLNSFVMSFKSHTLDLHSCLRDETGVSRLGE